jgi:hypothetical protein
VQNYAQTDQPNAKMFNRIQGQQAFKNPTDLSEFFDAQRRESMLANPDWRYV